MEAKSDMTAYGYVRGHDDDEPQELEEVTLVADSKMFRLVAEFAEHVADLIDQHGDKFGHEHFESFCKKRGIALKLRLVMTRCSEPSV